jgi:hypothetical protein
VKPKLCLACRQPFQSRHQVPKQSYCSSPACQRERRQRWQQDKLQTDPDYRDNHSRAQKAWLDRNPDYWREYRNAHPEYVERNRVMQQARNAKPMAGHVAKMDASTSVIPLPSGIYQLSLVTDGGIAKTDVWTVEITVHSCECKSGADIAKR